MPMGGPLSLWEKPSCKKLRGPMGGTKSKPNAVDSIWNGGARERQNECAMSFAIEMKKLVASDMSLATSWQGVTIPNPGSIKALRRNGYKTRPHLSHRFSGLFHYKIMPEPICQKQIGIKTYESASSPDGATFPSIISTTT